MADALRASVSASLSAPTTPRTSSSSASSTVSPDGANISLPSSRSSSVPVPSEVKATEIALDNKPALKKLTARDTRPPIKKPALNKKPVLGDKLALDNKPVLDEPALDNDRITCPPSITASTSPKSTLSPLLTLLSKISPASSPHPSLARGKRPSSLSSLEEFLRADLLFQKRFWAQNKYREPRHFKPLAVPSTKDVICEAMGQKEADDLWLMDQGKTRRGMRDNVEDLVWRVERVRNGLAGKKGVLKGIRGEVRGLMMLQEGKGRGKQMELMAWLGAWVMTKGFERLGDASERLEDKVKEMQELLEKEVKKRKEEGKVKRFWNGKTRVQAGFLAEVRIGGLTMVVKDLETVMGDLEWFCVELGDPDMKHFILTDDQEETMSVHLEKDILPSCEKLRDGVFRLHVRLDASMWSLRGTRLI